MSTNNRVYFRMLIIVLILIALCAIGVAVWVEMYRGHFKIQ
jgi:hypothetical protein